MAEISLDLHFKQREKVSIAFCVYDKSGKKLEVIESPWLENTPDGIDWLRNMYVFAALMASSFYSHNDIFIS